jgi:hypothetical protein
MSFDDQNSTHEISTRQTGDEQNVPAQGIEITTNKSAQQNTAIDLAIAQKVWC